MLSASSTSSVRRWFAIAQPTTRRLHASTTTARYRNPAHVGTYVMSATQSWSGPGAPKSRSTRSGAGRASRSRLVVHARPRREIPSIPARRMSRETRLRPPLRHRRRARHGSAEPRRSLASPHGSPRSGFAAPGPRRIARTAPACTTRSSRWWRPPACGTCVSRRTRPGGRSRTRTPAGRRSGLLSEPGRGFFQDLLLLAKHAHLAAETSELLLLLCRQAVRAGAFIPLGLPNPVPDRLRRWLELPR